MEAAVETLQNTSLKLKYNSAADIVIAEWPHVTRESLAELRSSLDLLLDFVRTNAYKNLLIDVRQSEVIIPSEEYNTLLAWFILELTDTNLHKIARVNPADYVRKNAIDKKEIDVYKKDYSVIFEEFNSYQEASCWLSLPL